MAINARSRTTRDAVAAVGGAPVGPVRDPAIPGAVVQLVRTGAQEPKGVTYAIPFGRAPQAVREVEGGHGRGKKDRPGDATLGLEARVADRSTLKK